MSAALNAIATETPGSHAALTAPSTLLNSCLARPTSSSHASPISTWLLVRRCRTPARASVPESACPRRRLAAPYSPGLRAAAHSAPASSSAEILWLKQSTDIAPKQKKADAISSAESSSPNETSTGASFSAAGAISAATSTELAPTFVSAPASGISSLTAAETNVVAQTPLAGVVVTSSTSTVVASPSTECAAFDPLPRGSVSAPKKILTAFSSNHDRAWNLARPNAPPEYILTRRPVPASWTLSPAGTMCQLSSLS